ncbi:MAG: thiamine phosphate synthase [Prevotella sp.]|nr:thiamine phosphate synthase [Prevotella sp.]
MMQIQFISHHNERFDEVEGIRRALAGGCRWIQLRMKEADDDQMVATALQVRLLCTEYGATFILDDRVHLVGPTRADGVHLGRLDMPVDEARRLLGPDRIIGGTANTLDDIRRLARQGADYIGCGPLRFTTTKERLAPLLGFDGYRRLIGDMRCEGIRLPLIAIGGITAEDLPELRAIGVDGIAVSGCVLRADHPEHAMQILINHEQ